MEDGLWISNDNLPISEANVFLYAHGGGYCIGHAGQYNTHFEWAVEQLGSSWGIYSVEYSLSPEVKYPVAINEFCNVFHKLLRQGVLPGNIIFGGDSAGGGLVTAAVMQLAKEGFCPGGLILISPWINHSHDAPSIQWRSDFCEYNGLEFARGKYSGSADSMVEMISPAAHENIDFSYFPPTFLCYGSCEILYDDCALFAGILRKNNVQLTEEIGADMPHIYPYYYPINNEEAKEAWFNMFRFMEQSVSDAKRRRATSQRSRLSEASTDFTFMSSTSRSLSGFDTAMAEFAAKA